MIKWTAFPFLRFLAAFISGILFYILTKPSFHYLPVLLTFTTVYFLVFLISRKSKSTYAFKPFLGVLGIGILFLSGIQVARQHDMLTGTDHVGRYINGISYYTATVINEPEEKERSFKTLISVNQIKTGNDWKPACGKIYLYVKREKGNKLIYGDQILIKGQPQLISGPANPEEFDYRKYLALQNIYHQQFISSEDLLLTGNKPPNYLMKWSGILRNGCDRIYKNSLPPDEYKMASALVLGIRNSLDPTIKDAYANTGTMHILAVSGLHVAIIFQILSILLGRINKVRHGNYILASLLLILLWFYAFITGLSPSVLRAVTMFSFMIIAKSMNRNTNIYNTLALSAFILLCFDPFFVLDVGFQLSYIAVSGIVYLHPKIYHSISILNPALDKIWEMTSISLAAQLATFPICLLYFHQFPVYFLLSNFLVIPISFLILYLGLGLLALAWFPMAAHCCAWCLTKLIWLMNLIVLTIEKFPYALINGIDITIPETIMVYAIIIYLLVFIYRKKLRYLSFCLMLIITFSSFQILKSAEKTTLNKMIVYNIKGHTAIGFIKKDQAELLVDSSLKNKSSKIKYHIYGHLYKLGISKIKIAAIETSESEIPHVYLTGALLMSWQGKSILMSGKNFKKENYRGLHPDFFIVRNNSILNIEEAEKTLKCGNLIIDSSNHPKYIKEVASSGNHHSVLKEGAIIIDF
jgi:competence protein ComEC